MLRTAIAIIIGLLLAGCGGNESENQQAERGRRISPPNSTPVKRVDEGPARTAIEGVSITPYFDEAGEVEELAVAPGEMFTIYVIGVNKHEPTTAAQYRLVLPDGIRVLGEEQMPERRLTLGEWGSNFMIAYNCKESEEPFWICRYTCVAEEEFAGGRVETAIGVPAEAPAFIGFSTCEHREMAASRGSAQLKRK